MCLSTERDLYQRVRSGMKFDADRSMTEWNQTALSEVHALVIDDVRMDRSNHSQSILETIIDGRYRNCLCTILTTNLDPELFTHSVGDSIADRIVQTGWIQVMDWESFRGEQRMVDGVEHQ